MGVYSSRHFSIPNYYIYVHIIFKGSHQGQVFNLYFIASVASDSLRSYRPYPASLICPWDSPGKNTRMGCHALLQGIFPDPGIKPVSPALAGRFFTTNATWRAQNLTICYTCFHIYKYSTITNNSLLLYILKVLW